jgi:hypothetical protein
MATIHFTHPQVRGGAPLAVDTGADMIRWSYTLNTANWPTYGGEVVQILSVAIEDVEIVGTAKNYAQMENIYSYFLEFVQIASQGRGKDPKAGQTAYNQQPMLLQYFERDWTMKIVPRSLPGFRKGRDVVAPEWRLSAYVVDDSEDIQELQDLVRAGVSIFGEDFELTGQVGYIAQNPFSDPFAGQDPKDGKKQANMEFDPVRTAAAWKEVGDFYNKIIPSWLEGDFDSVTKQFGSSPAFLHWGDPETSGGGGGKADQLARAVGGAADVNDGG